MTTPPLATSTDAVLDHPAYSALTGPQAHIAERAGRAVRYPADVSPFGAAAPDASDDDWRALAALGATPVALQDREEAPAGWTLVQRGEGFQMVLPDDVVLPTEGADPLGAGDVDDMLDLISRTRPGPFERRTIELGRYLGVREGGELIAMAGERMRPAGWTEISAVCTAPAHRGRGLARRLIGAVAEGIRDRGDRPFLHVAATNTGARDLYEAMGFVVRRSFSIAIVRPE